jgi:uncharacterized membrane protein YfcA
MTPPEPTVIAGVGLIAGTMNTIVGSGSLVTFPTLLALGYAPVLANVSNTIGLVPGSLSGAIGYRRELAGQRSRVLRLGIAAAPGGLTGGLLLLLLPASTFERIVPFLIMTACVLVALQPRLSRLVAARHAAGSRHGWLLALLIYLTGIYGGYFGAAQGVIFIAILAIFVPDDLQRLNGLKNALAVLVNGVAALLFIALSSVAWDVSVLLAIGAVAGGHVGAVVGRRLPPLALRAAIVVVGLFVSARMLAG